MRSPAAGVFVLAFALVHSDAESAQEPLLTLDRGAAYELTWSDSGDSLSARVYVTLKPSKDKAPISVKLEAIAEGRRTDPRLSRDFQVSPAAIAQTATSFDILVPKAEAIRAGTYEATLTFTATTSPRTADAEETAQVTAAANPAQQQANIQLIVPAAALALPANLQISRVVGLRGHATESGAALVVLETSGRSPATLHVRQSEPFSNADGQYGSDLVIGTETVARGSSKELRPTLDAKLPLGVVSGKLTISSDQLTSPITLPVQVRTRLSRLALLGTVVFGLALGFMLRMVLKPRIEVNAAREGALEAIDTLVDEIPDQPYRTALAEAQSRLSVAADARNATTASIAAAMTAAETARQAAVTGLNDRLKKAEGDRDALAAVVTPAWSLPERFSGVVVRAASEVTTVSNLISGSNAAVAQTRVNAAIEALRRDLQSELGAWNSMIGPCLRALTELVALIDAGRRADYQSRAKDLEEQAGKAEVAADADLPAMKTVLAAVHTIHARIPALVADVRDEVRRSFESMNLVISRITLDERDLWLAANAATAALVDRLNAIPTEATQWVSVHEGARALHAQWREALLAPLLTDAAANDGSQQRAHERTAEEKQEQDEKQRQKEEQIKQIETDFDSGHYERAAQALRKALGFGPRSTTLSTEVSAGPTPERDMGARREETIGEMPAALPRPRVGDAKGPPALSALRARLQHELLRDRIVQWLASAVALAFVGYLMFAERFIGTSGDLLMAFFWGFSTDIGVDALVTAARAKSST